MEKLEEGEGRRMVTGRRRIFAARRASTGGHGHLHSSKLELGGGRGRTRTRENGEKLEMRLLMYSLRLGVVWNGGARSSSSGCHGGVWRGRRAREMRFGEEQGEAFVLLWAVLARPGRPWGGIAGSFISEQPWRCSCSMDRRRKRRRSSTTNFLPKLNCNK
jgi:hypothetical protein